MHLIPDFLGPLRFIRQLRKNPPVKRGLAFLFLIRVCLALPAYWAEMLFRAKRIQNTPIEKTPIFILGHYRSGTTLLHKLLSSHPDWACINGNHVLFPYSSRFFRKILVFLTAWMIPFFNIQNPFYHNYRFRFEDPIEEENYLIYAISPYSAFWGFVFPKRFEEYLHRYIYFKDEKVKASWKANYHYLLKKITRTERGKRLVLKNPPNTGRIKLLLELFPDAKFIFLYRNPYAVFSSMDYLVKEVIQKSYSLQLLSTEEREELIFRHYQVLMDLYEKEKSLIPAGNLYELPYEQMIADPEAEIQKIFEALSLEGSHKIAPAVRAHLKKEKDYSTKKYYFHEGQVEKIAQNWGNAIKKWQYSPPDMNK